MTEIRLADYWVQVQTRLATAALRAIQGGVDRVYLATDPEADTPAPAADITWGRTVILPVTRMFSVVEAVEVEAVPFVVRCDRAAAVREGYNPLVSLEAAHAEIYTQLAGWVPSSVTGLVPAFPLYRREAPFRGPQYDAARAMWYVSAVYEMNAAAPVAA